MAGSVTTINPMGHEDFVLENMGVAFADKSDWRDVEELATVNPWETDEVEDSDDLLPADLSDTDSESVTVVEVDGEAYDPYALQERMELEAAKHPKIHSLVREARLYGDYGVTRAAFRQFDGTLWLGWDLVPAEKLRARRRDRTRDFRGPQWAKHKRGVNFRPSCKYWGMDVDEEDSFNVES